MKYKLFAALVAAAAAVSCGGVVDPSQNVTENFSGTLQPASQGGSPVVFTFNVSKSGEYAISVTSTNPTVPSGYIGVAFGQVLSGSCAVITANSYAQIGHTGSAGAIQSGTWCAEVWDPGYLATTTTFQATVKHP